MPNSYFRELNQEKYTQRSFYVFQGIVVIILGLLIWVSPEATLAILVFVAGLGLLVSGISGWYAYLRHKTPPALTLQTKTVATIQVLAGLILLVFPIFSVKLAVIAIILALILRIVLISLVFIKDDGASVKQRRWMAFSIIVTALVALIAVASLREPDGNLALLISLFLLIEGVELLRHAGSTAKQVRKERAYAAQNKHHSHNKLLVDEANPNNNHAWLELNLKKYQQVVIISPHPDDLEGFVGGLVLETPCPVTSVVMAGGNKGVWEKKFQAMVKKSPEEYIRLRLKESEEAAQLLGVKEVLYAGYRDREVTYTPEAVAKIFHILQKFQPDVIVSFEYQKWLNMYNHPDHVATARIVKSAVKKYRSAGKKCDYLLTSTWLPNRFLDVSDVREIKLKALAQHTTQQDLNAIIFPWFEKFFTRLWGLFTNSQYTEGYRKV